MEKNKQKKMFLKPSIQTLDNQLMKSVKVNYQLNLIIQKMDLKVLLKNLEENPKTLKKEITKNK